MRFLAPNENQSGPRILLERYCPLDQTASHWPSPAKRENRGKRGLPFTRPTKTGGTLQRHPPPISPGGGGLSRKISLAALTAARRTALSGQASWS
ncbi:hypothetical protein CRG98_026081, partial [Punica granatum]